MDPAAVMEASKVAAEEFRRDYLVASVVVLLLSHAIANWFWARAFARVVEKLSLAQEARVQDKKEDLRETGMHMDRATEAMTLMLERSQRIEKAMDAIRRSLRRDSGEAESAQVRKLRENP